jgi:hypothetical protein
VHRFLLSDGRQSFDVMVHDGEQGGSKAWVAISPDGDFDGADIQSTHKGRYIVSVRQPLGRRQGLLASKLARVFVTNYDAVDATVAGL